MTVRSVIIGLILAVLLGAITYANQQVLPLNPLAANHFPTIVFGMLLLVVAVNPLLRRLGRQVPLDGKELAVVLAMLLPACGPAGARPSGVVSAQPSGATAAIVIPAGASYMERLGTSHGNF